MKCKICSNKTNWDKSFGHKEFIVCPKCFELLRNKLGLVESMEAIFAIGQIIKDKEEEER